MKVELTIDEMKAVEDFIFIELLESIRRDEDFDNIDYVYNLLNVRAKFLKAMEVKVNAN